MPLQEAAKETGEIEQREDQPVLPFATEPPTVNSVIKIPMPIPRPGEFAEAPSMISHSVRQKSSIFEALFGSSLPPSSVAFAYATPENDAVGNPRAARNRAESLMQKPG